MNERIDPIVLTWLAEGPERSPDDLLERSLLATRQTRQRRWWAVPDRWLPDRVTSAGRSRMAASIAMLVVATLLMLAVVAALMIAGSQRRLPPPVGPAGNGMLAYDTGPGGIIYISNADGSAPRPLVGEVGVQRTPTFSPDGTMIAFWRRPDDSPPFEFELWIADADGGRPRKVSGDLIIGTEPEYNPSWSPDSRQLVFTQAPVASNSCMWPRPTDRNHRPRSRAGTPRAGPRSGRRTGNGSPSGCRHLVSRPWSGPA